MSDPVPIVDVLLPAASPSGARARRCLETLNGHLPDSTLHDLKLLVTETVSNAIRHSGAGADEAFSLRVFLDVHTVRVEVHDPGPGFDPQVLLPRRTESGWGLYLLDRLSRRWGVTSDEGTCVWFELSAAGQVEDTG